MSSTYEHIKSMVLAQAKRHAEASGRKATEAYTIERLGRLNAPFQRIESRAWPLMPKSELKFMAIGLQAAYAYALDLKVHDLEFVSQRELLPTIPMSNCLSATLIGAMDAGAKEGLARALDPGTLLARLERTRREMPSDELAVPIYEVCADHAFVAGVEFVMHKSHGPCASHASKFFIAVLCEYLLRIVAVDESKIRERLAAKKKNDEDDDVIDHVRPVGDLLDTLSHATLLFPHVRKPHVYVVQCAD